MNLVHTTLDQTPPKLNNIKIKNKIMSDYPKITKDKFFIKERKKMNREEFFNHKLPVSGLVYNKQYICIHCNKIIEAKDYTVTQDKKNGPRLITCPNSPECDGTIMDWWENTEKNRNFYEI